MRINRNLFLGVLVIGLLSFLSSQSRLDKLPECDKDNCGKVVGRIIDAETGENVEIEFYIAFCDCDIKDNLKIFNGDHIKYLITGDSNGKFSVKIPEGRYCLQFYPRTNRAKYAVDPTPSLNPKHTQMITVLKGRIATVRKLAMRGGSLKITLVDSNNDRINPLVLFNPRIDIQAKLSSEKISPALFGVEDESDPNGLNDGEIIINNLFPGQYDLSIEFENMGYGSQRFKNIEIERNKTKEINATININDKTGIEGRIVDQYNNPLRNIYINAKYVNDEELPFFSDFGDIYTDISGRYKIIGLKEQIYNLYIYGEINGTEVEKKIEGIHIKNDTILKRDIVIEISN